MLDKAALTSELIATLQAALEIARAAHASAIDGATNDEARPENSKDTRGLEQSYLARGQAQRVAELETAVAELTAFVPRELAPGEPIVTSALITVDEDGDQRVFFLALHGGGTVLAGGIQVVTPSSPLGRALLGRRVDDEVEVRLPGKQRTFVIAAIA